jgi:hypothetical protein
LKAGFACDDAGTFLLDPHQGTKAVTIRKLFTRSKGRGAADRPSETRATMGGGAANDVHHTASKETLRWTT